MKKTIKTITSLASLSLILLSSNMQQDRGTSTVDHHPPGHILRELSPGHQIHARYGHREIFEFSSQNDNSSPDFTVPLNTNHPRVKSRLEIPAASLDVDVEIEVTEVEIQTDSLRFQRLGNVYPQ